jgi:hypothetical protein
VIGAFHQPPLAALLAAHLGHPVGSGHRLTWLAIESEVLTGVFAALPF